MLSPLQQFAFKLYKKGVIYMYPLPIEFDAKSEKIVYNNSKKCLISFLTLYIFEVWLTVSCAYSVIGHYMFRKREFFNQGIAGMLTAAGITAGAGVLAPLIILKKQIINPRNKPVAQDSRENL